ncbi:MAG: adenylate/guanylate cyclase domain-containing protein [Gammaproteobacteria bacterium]
MLAIDAHTLCALLLIGVAAAFLHADARSRTSRALALALAAAGASVLANRLLLGWLAMGPLPSYAGWLALPEVIAFCAVFEWVLRVRHTIPAGRLRTRFGDGVLRAAQALVLVYGYNAVRHPEMRLRDFYGGLAGPGLWTSEVAILFGAPLALALLLWALSVVLCLQRAPEPAERVRLIAFLIAVPILAVGLILPGALMSVTTVLGVVVLLAGALRHAELRGRHAQFLQRFLSPQVAALVNSTGMKAAMREERRDIAVVCADLRGFTAYSDTHGPEAVIALLRDYYDAVGKATRAVEGTIKDYAGDGVMILIGAPLALPDQAARAVELAERIIETTVPILAHHDRSGQLGIGVGLATGAVAVGFVGGEGPLEYAAVGPAVNLAARLSSLAAAGEIVLPAAVAVSLGDTRFVSRPALMVKGYADPVEVQALRTPRDSPSA